MKTRWGDSKNEIGFDVYHIYEHVVRTQRCAEAEAEKKPGPKYTLTLD